MDAINDAIDLRPDDGSEVAVLLTSVVPNAAATVYRVILEEDGTGF